MGAKTHDENWKRKQSEGVKKAWAEGRYVGKRRPDYGVIASKNRGRKRPESACKATGAGVKAAWESGAYHTPVAIARREEHLQKLHAANAGATPGQMDVIRAQRDLEKLRPKWRETMKANIKRWKETGEIHQYRARARARLIGGSGFGTGKRGRLDHNAAKYWTIRDPYGRIYEFPNLREWVRQNLNLFNDLRPEARMPFWLRVSSGIKNLGGKLGKSCSYQGWVLVSVGELETGGKDLLGRDEAIARAALSE